MNHQQKTELKKNAGELRRKYSGAIICDHCPGVLIITPSDMFICEMCGATSFIVDSLALQDIPLELRADTIRHLFQTRCRSA